MPNWLPVQDLVQEVGLNFLGFPLHSHHQLALHLSQHCSIRNLLPPQLCTHVQGNFNSGSNLLRHALKAYPWIPSHEVPSKACNYKSTYQNSISISCYSEATMCVHDHETPQVPIAKGTSRYYTFSPLLITWPIYLVFISWKLTLI